ncbi:chaperonin 10-like protein [Apodospora peruviana]|uniref:Chaperonin 10-like protein n=1 Tax=Apodospora peruviana TaxID=516989 RepID=A0AAE0HXP6_9PEZI|nr:chaperonin 10-like protein [Apodospora peruviana]
MATNLSTIPAAMRSLAIRTYTKPSGYEVLDLPVPTITNPNDVLVRVHAAVIATRDTQFAGGMTRYIAPLKFPFRLSVRGSGVIAAIGSKVTSLKIGDPVYGISSRHGHLMHREVSFASDYVVVPADILVIKPANLSFEEAATLSASVLVAYQCVRLYFEMTGQPAESTLEGKTVFVPGALSATGSVGVQVAKNVFGASNVISTVSTAKLGLVEELLGKGVVDQVIDYRTENVMDAVGRGAVDFVYNTQWDLVGTFPLVKPDTGAIVSIASVPSSGMMRSMFGPNRGFILGLMGWVSDLVYMYYGWKLRGTNIKQDFLSGNPGVREDVERTGEWIAAGKIKAVMTVVELDDIEKVREACDKVATGKGGLGALVIKLV